MESALHIYLCRGIICLSLACTSICLTNTSVTWSTFQLINSAGTIEQSIVTKIYPGTDTSLTCAMKSRRHAPESFYYSYDSSMCYCNDQTDDGIVEDDGGSMVYGYLVKPGTPAECQHMYDIGFRNDGEFTTSTGKKILCNLTSLGWVVFQRRVDGSEGFRRNWDRYVAGFGDNTGEFWLGLEDLHQLTQSGCELHVYLEAEPDHPVQAKGYARYSNFSVGEATHNYTLYVDGFSGNVGDSLNFSSGYPFSTFDADHDSWQGGQCARDKKGGWWYSGIFVGGNLICHRSNLNSDYLGGQHSLSSGIRWKYPWGEHYSLLRTEMAYRCN